MLLHAYDWFVPGRISGLAAGFPHDERSNHRLRRRKCAGAFCCAVRELGPFRAPAASSTAPCSNALSVGASCFGGPVRAVRHVARYLADALERDDESFARDRLEFNPAPSHAVGHQFGTFVRLIELDIESFLSDQVRVPRGHSGKHLVRCAASEGAHGRGSYTIERPWRPRRRHPLPTGGQRPGGMRRAHSDSEHTSYAAVALTRLATECALRVIIPAGARTVAFKNVRNYPQRTPVHVARHERATVHREGPQMGTNSEFGSTVRSLRRPGLARNTLCRRPENDRQGSEEGNRQGTARQDAC